MKEELLELFRTVFEDSALDETTSQDTCAAWDSLKHLNLIVEVETTFNISLEPEEMAEIHSFSDMLTLALKKKEA